MLNSIFKSTSSHHVCCPRVSQHCNLFCFFQVKRNPIKKVISRKRKTPNMPTLHWYKTSFSAPFSIQLFDCMVFFSSFQPKDVKFEFPNIFPEDPKEKAHDDSKSLDQAKETFKKYLDRNKLRPGTPSWFSL